MRFQHINTHPLLKNYIDKMCVFERDGQMPAEDMKLIVHNGRINITNDFRENMLQRTALPIFTTTNEMLFGTLFKF